jgi:hypothetical protein
MQTSVLRSAVIAVSIVSGAWCSPLHGQWRLGVEVGAARFWGASRDTEGNQVSFRPYRPTTLGIGLERHAGRYAVGVRVHSFEASLGLVGPEVTVASEGAFTAVSFSPELAVRIATLGAGNQLRVHAGPLLEVWDLIDLDARTRLGAQGSISLDVPLGKRFGGVVQAGAAVMPSPFEEGELDVGGGAPTYELRALWRRSLGVGLRYQL